MVADTVLKQLCSIRLAGEKQIVCVIKVVLYMLLRFLTGCNVSDPRSLQKNVRVGQKKGRVGPIRAKVIAIFLANKY